MFIIWYSFQHLLCNVSLFALCLNYFSIKTGKIVVSNDGDYTIEGPPKSFHNVCFGTRHYKCGSPRPCLVWHLRMAFWSLVKMGQIELISTSVLLIIAITNGIIRNTDLCKLNALKKFFQVVFAIGEKNRSKFLVVLSRKLQLWPEIFDIFTLEIDSI